jgi:hypothetical protein
MGRDRRLRRELFTLLNFTLLYSYIIQRTLGRALAPTLVTSRLKHRNYSITSHVRTYTYAYTYAYTTELHPPILSQRKTGRRATE